MVVAHFGDERVNNRNLVNRIRKDKQLTKTIN